MTSEKFATQWFYCGEKSTTVTRKKGILKRQTEDVDVYQANMPDFEDYSKKLATVYNQLDTAGYQVVNVVPVNIGSAEGCYGKDRKGRRTYLGETAFSTTRGAVVVGQRREHK